MPPAPERWIPLRHATWALLAFLLTALGWAVASTAWLLAPRSGRLAAWVTHLWGRAVLVAAGARLRVEGRENIDARAPCLLVANHASFLDPPAMLAAFPSNVRIVMKKELGRLPFLGWYVRLARHFLLDRESARAGKEVLAEAVERAKERSIHLLTFPEGTRSLDGRLQPLKAGMFQIAVQAHLPVQPVAIAGTHEIMPKRSFGPRRGGEVVLRIGTPIPTDDLEGSRGRKIVAERVRDALLALGVPDGADGSG